MAQKREILPTLNKVISALVALSPDCAKLEMMDNDQASRRLKRDISIFKHTELKEFSDLILGVRSEIREKTPREQSINQKSNLKKQNNESESESGTA